MEDWKKFRGREKELGALMDAWEKAKTGDAQSVVLLGDSGLGKTRIIHEFYRRIVKEGNDETAEGYWPEELSSDPTKTVVNPELVSSKQAPIPWLWWGIRWDDPGERKRSSSRGILDYRDFLYSHAIALINKRSYRDARNEAALNAAEMVIDFLPIPNLLGLAVSSRGVWGSIREMWKKRKEDQESYGGFLKNAEKEVVAATGLLRAYLDSGVKDAENLPVILLLDDAQWADPMTLKLASDLYYRAKEAKWPLLLLVTHWETEWKQAAEGKILQLDAKVDDWMSFRDVETTIRSLEGGHESLNILRVDRLENDLVKEVLISLFPCIQDDVVSHIQGRCDGNMLICMDYLRILQNNEHWFVDGDIAKPLVDGARSKLLNKNSKTENDTEERVATLLKSMKNKDGSLYEFLSFGATQGISFFNELVAEMAVRLKQRDASWVEIQAKNAEQTHSVISVHHDSKLSEFRHRIYKEGLKERMGADWGAYREVLIDILDSRWGRTDGEGDGLPNEMLHMYLSLLEEKDEPAWKLAKVKARLSKFLAEQDRKREAGSLADEAAALIAGLGADAPVSKQAVQINNEIIYAQVCAENFSGSLLQTAQSNYDMASKLLSPESSECLEASENLGDVLLMKGDYLEAKELISRRLNVAQSAFDPEHEETLNAMRDLARVLSKLSEDESALELYQESFSIKERLFGSEHYQTRQAMVDLGIAYISVLDLQNAYQYHQLHYEVTKRAFGDAHVETLQAMRYLIETLVVGGCCDHAKPLADFRLKELSRTYGKHHRNTIDAMISLANLEMTSDNLEVAKDLLSESSRLCSQLFQQTDDTAIRSNRMLADVFLEKGDIGKARVIQEQLFELQKEEYEPDHPELLYEMEHLAWFYEEIEDFDRAEVTYLSLLEKQNRVFGEGPKTKKTGERIARLWASKFPRKTTLDKKRYYEMLKGLLGKDHKTTLEAMHELANKLRDDENYDDAETLIRQLLEIRQQTLGADDDDTIFTQSMLLSCLEYAGKSELDIPFDRREHDLKMKECYILSEEEQEAMREYDVSRKKP